MVWARGSVSAALNWPDVWARPFAGNSTRLPRHSVALPNQPAAQMTGNSKSRATIAKVSRRDISQRRVRR